MLIWGATPEHSRPEFRCYTVGGSSKGSDVDPDQLPPFDFRREKGERENGDNKARPRAGPPARQSSLRTPGRPAHDATAATLAAAKSTTTLWLFVSLRNGPGSLAPTPCLSATTAGAERYPISSRTFSHNCIKKESCTARFTVRAAHERRLDWGAEIGLTRGGGREKADCVS